MLSPLMAAEVSYKTVAALPRAKFSAIDGTELFGPKSEAIANWLTLKYAKHNTNISAFNVTDMLSRTYRGCPRIKVGKVVIYFT